MPRKFKPGDWVKVKGKLIAPKMQVLKYVPKKKSILGLVDNDNYLECVWYKNGDRKTAVFHQNKLIKMIETGGLFKILLTTPRLNLT
ncbi:uncharacterized protein YodC (DUF2158 family) [Tenacibaculum adriaticum]|uniref:Uncharacterized protein YodC (DUF2158 family) n=1 Tax=Tenacibaculum adriaticum TaxID=413713 RepID=A0A5S5DPK3_9FLAO|nr:hypothetical protein [Tenacibaculum adriaticum]TYP97837.1 uncharacterized protein YodC (DUF2158 family) [Tenacibaculum adriaticum]